MTTNSLGSGVSRFIDDRDRNYAAIIIEANKPVVDSELNLISFIDLESQAELLRSEMPSGWLMNESDPRSDYFTDPNWSNLFFFGRQATGEIRFLQRAVVNGWVIPVAGTRTGTPPLTPNDSVTWNQIELNPPSTSTGGNRAEFVFLEVWLQRIDVDPAFPSIAPGKPLRGFIYKFGNVESGFSYLPDELVDPDINFETSKRVQIQYRIRVVTDVNLAQYPEGFDPTLVFAQGALSTPSALFFSNMRSELGDPGLWRAGSGDPTVLGTVDGYVYAIPICVVFRRNGAGFSDVGNLAGAFNRNSSAVSRDDATIFISQIVLPANITDTDVQFTLTSITGTVLTTMTSFGEAYFKIDDEIVRINNVSQTGPTSFVVSMDRGQLQTTIRSHLSGTPLIGYTVRPDGLYADQIASTDILDLRHSIADKFDYDTILKTNFLELLKGNLRTTWKRYGSTNSAGPIITYGDRITDGSIFVGGLTRLDGPNGNRRAWSDAVFTERFEVPVAVPTNATALTASLQVAVNPYTIDARWETAAPGHPPGTRLNGIVQWWFNGDSIRLRIAPFQAGLAASDIDQVRFVLPTEDPDAVLIHFEGMTTDPNGGMPSNSPFFTSPTATNPAITTTAPNRILKDGLGISVSLDSLTGDLIITLNSGTSGSLFAEFTDAVPTPASPLLSTNTVMHIEFAVTYGAGRGLSHKPEYIHTTHYRGSPTNSSKVMLRPGLSDRNRMIPTYINESPYVQTGKNRNLSRTSEVMLDPGSKTIYVAPYRNVLIPPLLARDGSQLNWYAISTFQGAMPLLNQSGSATVYPAIDPLSLFYTGALTRYVEIPLQYLPRPGLHHVPIIPTTNAVFPSGINFLLVSKEGPFGAADTSDWNRNLVSYPSTAGYYVVTPKVGESYGTGSLPHVFGRKYSNPKIRATDGGPFRGIQFPPFYAPARITGIYARLTTATIPASTPFNTDRVFVGGPGTDVNLMRDDYDGPTFLLDVDSNGDLAFILNAEVIDFKKAPAGSNFDNIEFFVECTLFGFDRGFLQTNGRVLIARTSGGGSIPIPINTFTTTTDNKIGIICPAPLSLNATNNELTVYYSHQPYQGDVFGSQNAYSDDIYRLGPLTISEQNSLASNSLGPVNTLTFPNRTGFEVVSAINFVTSLGTGRLSGSVPIPLLTSAQNPTSPPDYTGTLVDLWRRFSFNRTGFEDWATPKFPVLPASLSSRPAIKLGGISEVFDRDVPAEFAGCVVHLPIGAWFRDKDFAGKILYQIRNASGVAAIQNGTLSLTPYQAPTNATSPAGGTWEGTEFTCGQASGSNGVGGESIALVDGTSNVNSTTVFKTARGGAGWSLSKPWPGGPITSKMPKSRPNTEVGSLLVGTAYLVRSQPQTLNSVEIHAGQELQMVIVTRGIPAYFRDTDVLHSAIGTNEGFTAIDRYRIWGRPLEKRRGDVPSIGVLPTPPPLFQNDIFDDPIFFGSSDVSLISIEQEILPIISNGQTIFALSQRPLAPDNVIAWLNGVKITYGIDYTITGPSNQIFTYIVSGSNPPLLTTDKLELYYPLL